MFGFSIFVVLNVRPGFYFGLLLEAGARSPVLFSTSIDIDPSTPSPSAIDFSIFNFRFSF